MHSFSALNSFQQSLCLMLAFEETHRAYVEPCTRIGNQTLKLHPNKEHLGNNINSAVVSFVEMSNYIVHILKGTILEVLLFYVQRIVRKLK